MWVSLLVIGGLLIFLAKFVFGKNVIDAIASLSGRLEGLDKKNDAGFDRLSAKIEILGDKHHVLDSRLSMGAETFKRHDDSIQDLKVESRKMESKLDDALKQINQIRYLIKPPKP